MATPTTEAVSCDDCGEPVLKFVSLMCSVHSICRSCLVKRARTKRGEALKCGRCEDSSDGSSATSPPGIWVFVDDSNIWIEAKKLQSQLKKLKTIEDHRLRIDMGKLAGVIAGDRYVESGILYASEPPPLVDVWQNTENKAGWYVDRSERHRTSHGTGKQIDAKLVADATATAIVTPLHQRTTMAFVTGDANVVPALKKIIHQQQWTIEIYMWKQSISKKLLEFSEDPSQSGRVKIIPLDDSLDKISFSQNELDVVLTKGKKNSRQRKHRLLAKPYGVVFTMEAEVFPNSAVSKEWVENLEAITRWPFQYYWFIAGKERTNDLVIIFQKDQAAGTEFDLDHFMKDEKDQILTMPLMHVLNIQTFREFISKKHIKEPDEDLKMWDEALEKLNEDSFNDGYHATESDSSSTSNMSDFKQVRRRIPRSKQRFTKWCVFKKNCINGTRCHNRHSEDDKSYFRRRKDGRGNPKRKTLICNHFQKGTCTKSKNECDFAHGEDDTWCTNCLRDGHLAVQCKTPKRKKTSLL